jgi:myo-inositol-1-phosphate synthase
MSPPSIDQNPAAEFEASSAPSASTGTSGHTIVHVASDNIKYNDDHIVSKYVYENAIVSKEAGKLLVKPTKVQYEFKTETTVPRVGYSLSPYMC